MLPGWAVRVHEAIAPDLAHMALQMTTPCNT